MLKHWFVTTIAAVSFFSGTAFAQNAHSSDTTADSIQVYSHTPCGGWRFDSDAMAHVCSFTDMRINVPDAYDVADVMRAMLQRIEALEAEITTLKAEH